MTTLTSRNGALTFGPGLPVVLINDQLRVMDQIPGMLAALRRGDIDIMVQLAHRGRDIGLDMVDILLVHPSLDEVALLPRIAARVQEEVGCPISLDSRHPEALVAALEVLKPYKALINSVTAEKSSLEVLLPIAADYGAAIIGMPIGDIHGLPKTVEGRLAEAEVILEAAARYGIPQDDVVMDAICLASSAEPASMPVTLETLRRFHEVLGVATVLGIGNAGHGMPQPKHIDLAYLIAAIPWGLDAALVSPKTPLLIEQARAIDFLTGRDPYGKGYIKNYRAKRKSE